MRSSVILLRCVMHSEAQNRNSAWEERTGPDSGVTRPVWFLEKLQGVPYKG